MQVPNSAFTFLNQLKENNTREWMQEHKKEYQSNEKQLKAFYEAIRVGLSKTDEIEKVKVFRINRDVRFSNNKTPYNVHRSASFSRAGAHRRGSYYLRLEPGASMIGGGFFGPEPADLLRIRNEFEIDVSEIKEIIDHPPFKKIFGKFNQEYKVKTAPKGFSKEDPNIEFIRLKSYFFTHSFTDEEVFDPNFEEKVVQYFELLRPYFDYMSDVLTTDLNGESLID